MALPMGNQWPIVRIVHQAGKQLERSTVYPR